MPRHLATATNEHIGPVTRLERRARRASLASERRAGLHVRRALLRQRRSWLQRAWWRLALLAVGLLTLPALALVTLPRSLAIFIAGGVVASIPWMGVTVWRDNARVVAQRSGIQAEVSTVHELTPLLKNGWHLVNHVMLERADVDHALAGPGGFFAIETKYRSDWKAAVDDLAAMTTQARRAAHSLQGRMGLGRRTVQAVLVMWGPDAEAIAERQPEIDGVVLLAGTHLADWVRSRPVTAGSGVVDQVVTRLHDYVARRDYAENAEFGPLPRGPVDTVGDLGLSMSAAVVTFYAVLVPAMLPPVPFWSPVTAALMCAVGLVARQRFRAARMQRITAAVIATAAGLLVLLLAALIAVAIL